MIVLPYLLRPIVLQCDFESDADVFAFEVDIAGDFGDDDIGRGKGEDTEE